MYEKVYKKSNNVNMVGTCHTIRSFLSPNRTCVFNQIYIQMMYFNIKYLNFLYHGAKINVNQF